jgi:sporulation integral membrane protein YlbJ
MKKKIVHLTFCLLCFLAVGFIFKNNTEVATIILEGINLFFKKVFVSLFPMFLINDILIYLEVPYYFYRIFKNLFNRLFHVSGTCAYVFFMSLISGTPSSAYILKNLVDEETISISEAEHYLTFTYFSNPLFLNLMLNQMFNSKTTIKIILIHYLSNVIIAFLMRKKAPTITNSKLKKKQSSIGTVISNSIKRTMSTLLLILGVIIFYKILSYILTSFLPNIPTIQVIISGFLEITNGLNKLINLNITIKIKEIIAIFIISFGGLSIHTQVKSILEDTPISYLPFLKGRIMQTLLGFILILIF